MKYTKGTVKHFNKCKPLHDQIWRNDSLGWLNSWNDQGPTEQYELIKKELLYNKIAGTFVVIVFSIGCLVISALLIKLFPWISGRNSGIDHFVCIAVSSFIAITCLATADNWLEELLDGWVSAKWDTAKFFTDVLQLERIVYGQDYSEYKGDLEVGYGSSLDMLRRSGLEMIRNKVPKDVYLRCEEWLLSQIKEVLTQEKSHSTGKKYITFGVDIHPLGKDSIYIRRKDNVNQGFELFKSFKILPKDARLDFYYKQVETTLDLEGITKA